jgi:hypothetical protein
MPPATTFHTAYLIASGVFFSIFAKNEKPAGVILILFRRKLKIYL